MRRITLTLIFTILFILGIVTSSILFQQKEQVIPIDPLLKDNKAAQEIAALGIEVDVEDLGTDSNGFTVSGQTRWYSNGTIVEVVLDDSIDPNSYEAHAILYHELGHVLDIQTGIKTTEERADNYAASRGYNIVDAYHGLK